MTDDWRTFDNPQHIRGRIVATEDRLVQGAHTVVCSQVLADRRWAGYVVDTPVVATPSSGYQTRPTTAAVVEANDVVEAVREAVRPTPAAGTVPS